MIVFNGFQTTDEWERSKFFNNYGSDGVKGFAFKNLGTENAALWRVIGANNGKELEIVSKRKVNPGNPDIASDDKPWNGYYIEVKSAKVERPTTIEAWVIGPRPR